MILIHVYVKSNQVMMNTLSFFQSLRDIIHLFFDFDLNIFLAYFSVASMF